MFGLVSQILFGSVIISPLMGDIIANVPENGVGQLTISLDDSEDGLYNHSHIVAIFDTECLNDDAESTVQQSKVDELISDYYPCLVQLMDHNFPIPNGDVSLTFFRITDVDEEGIGESCIYNEEVSIDYNELCINMFTYEPYFELDSHTLDEDEYDCKCQDTECCNLPGGCAWGLDQIDKKTRDAEYCYPDITFDNGVDLHILDTGISSTHNEFYGYNNIYHINVGFGNINGPWLSDHGTHVAGTAGGINYGTSKSLNIYDYLICPTNSCPYCLIFNALYNVYLILNSSGRRGVLNLSIGGAKFAPFDSYYDLYFQYIQSVGGIVVVAAGNNNGNACNYQPSFSSYAITVGAATESLTKASFSNWGECVEIWAPGDDIVSASSNYFHVCNSCYATFSGTSMASPHIAGLVANMIWKDPSLTHNQILTNLLSDTTKITGGYCDYYDYYYNLPCYFPHVKCDNCELLEKCDNEPCSFSEAKYCKVFNYPAGCNQCNDGYFKKNHNYQCQHCQNTFGSGCLFCQDYNGCGQCDTHCVRVYDDDCDVYTCQCSY